MFPTDNSCMSLPLPSLIGELEMSLLLLMSDCPANTGHCKLQAGAEHTGPALGSVADTGDVAIFNVML